MELIFLHGPPAVGKLTIGKALAATTGLPLFHNHYVVDAVSAVFAFQTPSSRTLREGMWLMMFEEAARTGQSLIFTFAPETTISRGFIDETVRVIEVHGGRVRFVALTCSEDEQARRVEAPSRRSFAKLQSASQLRELAAAGWLDFGPLPAELTLDTTLIAADEAAHRIAEELHL